jgi:hypothetical protein
MRQTMTSSEAMICTVSASVPCQPVRLLTSNAQSPAYSKLKNISRGTSHFKDPHRRPAIAPDHTEEAMNMKAQEREELLQALKARFEKNMHRHQGIAWDKVRARLESHPEALKSLRDMEATGGEPDVIGQDKAAGCYVFCDCAAESPAGRRSLCYDREALDSRKENKPQGSAVEMAVAMGIELLTEEQYRALQALGEFDAKTSSWVETPDDVRALGGALFCDRRYGKVFLYHNGAQSYYAARGFRGMLRV